MKKCLIYETMNPVSELNIVESNNNDSIRLNGVFGVCGIKNGNNRIYEKSNYSKMVEQLQSTILSEGCPGELEHPNSMNINLENVSHKIESIKIDENGVVSGTILLLNTPKGKIAQAIVEGGLPLYISSRATGNVDECGHVVLDTIKTYDLVGTPGFSQAKLNLSKTQKFESLNEGLCIITENDDNTETLPKDDEINTTDMEKEETEEKVFTKEEVLDLISNLTRAVKTLKCQVETNESRNKERIESITESINTWVNKEVIPTCVKETTNTVIESIAPGIEKWITEEYSPNVQKWITEEYSPNVQKWITEEYSPNVQKWITEEYSPVIDKWVNEELTPSIYSNINEYLTENSSTTLNDIDNMLQSISESTDTTSNNAKLNTITESLQHNSGDKYANLNVVKLMPKDIAPIWNSLSESKKDELITRSRIYNFTNESAVANFWNSMNFMETVSKPKVKTTLNENLSSYEMNVIRQLKK